MTGKQGYETKGYTKYGAQMGRRSSLDGSFAGHVTLRSVPLDEGGYDPGGAYWGAVDLRHEVYPLFVVTNEDGYTSYFRAKNFDAAREHVSEEFPEANIVEPTEVTDSDISEMVSGYVAIGLAYSYATDDDRDREIDMSNNFSESDLSEDALRECTRVCETFARNNASVLLKLIGKGHLTWRFAGRDLWYAQHDLGTGFSESDWGEQYASGLRDEAEKLGMWSYFYSNDGTTVEIEG